MGGDRASCATPPLANAAEPLAVADACRSENAKPMAPIHASAPAGGQFDFHGSGDEQQFQQLSAGLHEQRCDLIHSSRSMTVSARRRPRARTVFVDQPST